MAADILRHGHQSDKAAVSALATVTAVRHIAATATATAAPATAGQGFHRRFPVLPARQRTTFRHPVHIPLEHRRNIVAGRFPEPARRVRRRRQ